MADISMVEQVPDASNSLRLGTRKDTRGPLTDARDRELTSTDRPLDGRVKKRVILWVSVGYMRVIPPPEQASNSRAWISGRVAEI